MDGTLQLTVGADYRRFLIKSHRFTSELSDTYFNPIIQQKKPGGFLCSRLPRDTLRDSFFKEKKKNRKRKIHHLWFMLQKKDPDSFMVPLESEFLFHIGYF